MFSAQIPKINPGGFSRCEERRQKSGDGKSLSPIEKADAALKENIYQAIWKDDVLRATDYYEVDAYVKNGVVYLNGHIISITSQERIKNAIRTVPGILEIKNSLVLDDELTLEVAASLGKLENTNGCKFFTGVSHGVVSLNGMVSKENVKLLAEKCAASIPNVRGVINNVRISGGELKAHDDQPFLQPAIGELIYFLDGISGYVRQVIIDPDNRRVIAMTIQGRFAGQQQYLNSLVNSKTQPLEQLVTVPMNLVRYLTRVSGFLNIQSNEIKNHMDFDPGAFFVPNKDWVPPYPYCPEDVLIPVKHQNADIQIVDQSDQSPLKQYWEIRQSGNHSLQMTALVYNNKG